MDFNWVLLLAGSWLAAGWLLGCWLAAGWLLAGLAAGWVLAGCLLIADWLPADWLAAGWLWLAAGLLLAGVGVGATVRFRAAQAAQAFLHVSSCQWEIFLAIAADPLHCGLHAHTQSCSYFCWLEQHMRSSLFLIIPCHPLLSLIHRSSYGIIITDGNNN